MRSSTPVLLLAWRRPELLRTTIQAVRVAAPQRVFVACDGPRDNNQLESRKVAETREVIKNEIDWDCEIRRLYSSTNLGCCVGVSRAISWFFEHVDEGIILEDDCIPHPDFFSYCSAVLDRFRYDQRVWCASGNNFLNGQIPGDSSYYFSKYPHCWGWATWRRAWQHFAGGISFWPQWKESKEWASLMADPKERCYWRDIFDRVHIGQIDSWAYPWAATVWKHGGLTTIPKVNLVRNIGFGDDATHTESKEGSLSVPTRSLGSIRHAWEVVADKRADAYVFATVFGGALPEDAVRIHHAIPAAISWIGKFFVRICHRLRHLFLKS